MKLRYLFLYTCLFLTACHATPDAIQSDGKPLYLSDYRGKWVVVNYWAAWCHPCLAELPELNTLYRQHADTVVVLGVSFDGLSNTDLQQFAKTQHLSFPLFSHFPIEKFGAQEISSLPMSFLITPQGKLAKILYGPQTQKSILENIRGVPQDKSSAG